MGAAGLAGAILFSAPAVAGTLPVPQSVNQTDFDLGSLPNNSFLATFRGILYPGGRFSLSFTQSAGSDPITLSVHGRTILTTDPSAGSNDYSTMFTYYGDRAILFSSAAPTDPGYTGTAGQVSNLKVAFITAPVPEPEIWLSMLLGAGLAGAAARRARRPGRVSGSAAA